MQCGIQCICVRDWNVLHLCNLPPILVSMGNAACIHSKICNTRKKSPFLTFLSTSWAGSVLNWTDSDLAIFAQCLSPVKIKANEEIPLEESKSVFIIAEGGVEIHAIVQDIQRRVQTFENFYAKRALAM